MLELNLVRIGARYGNAFAEWAVGWHLNAVGRRRARTSLPNECLKLVLKKALPDVVRTKLSRENGLNMTNLLIASDVG